MIGFKTYVITKKTLVKLILLIIALTAAFVGSYIFFSRIVRNDVAVDVFSGNAEKILGEGIAGDNTKTLKESVTDMIGFDADNPESVINDSSASFKSMTTPKPVPKKTPKPQENDVNFLPSHEEIAVASGLEINNATNYEVDINELCKNPLDINTDLKNTEVLIIHTHTTECYFGNEMTGESERTTNEKYNMCRIGEAVAETLNLYGIKTVHDKTIHDYPSYRGSYTRALNTIEKNIREHPNIKAVLDIHRDAYVYSDGTKLRVATDDGAAKVMLVLGTDSMGLDHPDWKSNLTLAAKIQNAAEIMYPGLMRPLNLRRERFNMHVTTGSLLLEIGSNGNSLAEAEKSAVYIGKAIAAALING